jgi:hypothetical protein
MDWHWYHWTALVLGGLAAGFINTLAGSGSAITLAVMGMLGLPANVANATNRIQTVVQGLVATAGFSRQKLLDWHVVWPMAIPVLTGAFFGARLASVVSAKAMGPVIGACMLLLAGMIVLQPKRWIQNHQEQRPIRFRAWHVPLLLGIGFYGGFIQMGIGVFLLATLVLGVGMDLVRGNAAKVFLAVSQGILSVGVFLYSDLLHWGVGLTLSAGSCLGAILATRLAGTRHAPRIIRWVLLAAVLLGASKYLGLWGLVGELLGGGN